MLFANGNIRYLIIWYAIILHLVQGSLLIASPTAGWVTSTAHVRQWIGIGTPALGGLYLVVSGLSIWGLLLFRRFSLGRLIIVMPQQVLLIMAATGAGLAIAISAFADGVVRSRYFIAADQVPIIIAAVLHSIAIIDGRLELLWKWWRSR